MSKREHAIRVPSFSGFRPSSPASSRAKRANPARDTIPELCLRRALWRLGLRYQTHWRKLPGRPDIVFCKAKLAIFCDGDFWHGRNWTKLHAALRRRANQSYWTAKIAANKARDERTRRAIRRRGWKVVRLWETDIKRDPDSVAFQLKKILITRLRAIEVRGVGSV